MLKRLAVGLYLASIATNAHSATVTTKLVEEGYVEYHISGTITSGDYNKLFKIVSEYGGDTVVLNSHGGDMVEAMKMGDLIAQQVLRTEVRDGDVCASACFFIWLNGNPKWSAEKRPLIETEPGALNNIGLHRPYLTNPSTQQKSLERQFSAQKAAAAYLEKRLIPRRLIDLMMARPSNDIYWLTANDVDELGDYSPDIEELLIAKCGYDRRRWGKYYNLKQAGQVAAAEKIKMQWDAATMCGASLLGDLSWERKVEIMPRP